MRSPISVQQVYPFRVFLRPVEHAPFQQTAYASTHITILGLFSHA